MGLEHYYNARLGVFLSVIGHLILLLFLTSRVSTPGLFEQPVVYSVTLEGGKSLGGISQVAKKDEPVPVVPPKAAAPKPEPAAPQKAAEVEKSEAKVEPVKAEPSDAEVSLAEKEAKKKAEQEAKQKEQARKVEEEKQKAAAAAKAKAEAEARAKREAEKKKETAASAAVDINKQLQQAVQRYVGESTDAGGRGFGAGALGGAAMGGGIVRPPEFFAYRDALMAHIKSTWKWHDTSAALIAQVELDIETDGRITRAVLASSSGNREYDESVMRAINRASPVPPPPPIVYNFFKRVRLTFDPRD